MTTLTEHLQYLLRSGGGYDLGPDLGAGVLDGIDAFPRPIYRLPE